MFNLLFFCVCNLNSNKAVWFFLLLIIKCYLCYLIVLSRVEFIFDFSFGKIEVGVLRVKDLRRLFEEFLCNI